MRPREFFALALLSAAAVAQADPSDYGKVDTFQPGKKYNCVPSADRKGWDCKVTGNADVPQVPQSAQAPAAAPAPAHEAFPAAPAAPPTAKASALPGYLAAPNPGDSMQPMPAAPTLKPAPKPRVKGPMVPASTAGQAPAKPARVEPAPAAQDFLALPADAYVIELAQAPSESGLVSANPPLAKVYKVHLRQNGADVWLLVCGPYQNLQAARAARGELAAQGTTPGWPRRVGPLQTEARRTQP
ncbi:MAG: hypothetical protein KGP08_11555 [Xanthomonadaceae bacterium]|nr:hypothetical protein [Xanthomonadaceae bacterium]MDE2257055.1 hypothetical protein [Xanthomonadaceae bacterium]